jgi:hypothetical protein
MIDYKFYNANPLGNIEQDCVCRAISTATGIPYKSVERKLELIGELFECEALCVCCYKFFLENVLGLKPKYANGKTVREISKDFYNHDVIIRIDGHLTCSLYGGVVYDIWDCTDENADIFWIVY